VPATLDVPPVPDETTIPEPRMRSRAKACLALACLLSACGRSSPATAVERLRWTSSDASSWSAIETVAVEDVPAELAPWDVVWGRPRILETERDDGTVERGLRLGGQRVAVDVPTEAESVRAVRVDLIANQSGELRLELDGDVRASCPLAARGDSQSIVLPLSQGSSIEPDDGVVRVALEGGPRSSWVLERVHLLDGNLAGLFPDPDGARRPILLANDARPAVGLVRDERLEARSEEPLGPGVRVAFSVGRPAFARPVGPEEGATLSVRLLDGKREVARASVPLPEPDAWARVRVDVPEPLDTLTVRARLESDLPARVHGCLVTDPRILRPRESPRSILLVTSDTHRADHLGLVDEGLYSDAIDALGRSGSHFDNCWSTTNLTIPSHVAMLTGRHPRDTGVLNNATRITARAPTLAEAFAAAGFRTLAVVSSRHLRDPNSGLGQGFDRMSWPTEGPRRSAGESIAKLREWLDEPDDLPLFVWLHLFDAHHPYDPPPEFRRRYGLEDVSERMITGFEASPALRRVKPKLYAGEISYLDAELGGLLTHRRFVDAAVALTSDHGENLGDGGYFWNHKDLYPSVVRVPLVLRLPGVPRRGRVSSYVSNVDVGRTLLNFAGLERVAWPGRDLTRPVADVRPEPIFALGSHAEAASITFDGWHLILHLVDETVAPGGERHTGLRHAVRLFDLRHDPDCRRDRSRDELARARALRAALIEWLLAAEPAGWASDDDASAADLAELEALGYTTAAVADASEWFDPNCGCERCARYQR